MTPENPIPESGTHAVYRNFTFIKRLIIQWITAIAFVFFVSMFQGCGGGSDDSSGSTGDTTENTTDDTTDSGYTYDSDELPTGPSFSGAYNGSDASVIVLGSPISVTGDGATISGSVVTITTSGTYNISGTLTDGQIKVDIADTTDTGDVWLYLDGVDISCSDSAPIDIENAERVIVALADGKNNILTDMDSSSALDGDDENIDAALYSKEDLVICGTGTLTVNANYKDGIKSKDGLIIDSGTLVVTSTDDGIIGKNYISVEDGDISIDAGGDGMKSTNDGDAEQGYIYIYNGYFDITAGGSGSGDAIQVETHIVIEDGVFDLLTAEGHLNPIRDLTDVTAKGLKAPVGVTVYGGTFTIDTADDALHSNDTVMIHGGDFVDIASGDDGIHGDLAVTINGGDINISGSYEGIEGLVITINDGDIHVLSDDDPINASGSGGGISININGGYMYFECENADGLDSNGAVVITGGTVIINGPEGGANGILDYASFSMTGGLLIGAGTSNMAMPAGGTNSQNSLMIYFSTKQDAGTLIHIETGDGATEVVTFEPTVRYQAIELSSSLLTIGTKYNVYLGGTDVDGTDNYGLGGTYNHDVDLYTTFTFSSNPTTVRSGG